MVGNLSQVQKEGAGAALYAGSSGFMAGLKEQVRARFLSFLKGKPLKMPRKS